MTSPFGSFESEIGSINDLAQLRRVIRKWEWPANSTPLQDLASSMMQAANHVKEAAIRAVATSTGYSNDDLQVLWAASERFLKGLPALANFHKGLIKYENETGSHGLWNHNIRLEPWGTVLICLPSNAVIPLALILSAALIASGNRVIFAVSSGGRHSGILILDAIRDAVPDRMLIWSGGVREVVEGLVETDGAVDLLYFIGGSQQFSSIAEKCAKTGIPLVYEGEGRGVVIVDDALSTRQLRHAVREIIAAKTFCLGQMCSAPDAVFIPERQFQTFVEYYDEECLKYPSDSVLNTKQHEAFMAKVQELNAIFGQYRPCTQTRSAIRPLYWIAQGTTGLNTKELFFPGIIVRSMPHLAACIETVGKSRFRLQVTLFSNRTDTLETLVLRTRFARYCSWISPAQQDSLLPWGNYGRSGTSDVLDFYRKGFRRTIVEGDSTGNVSLL